MYLRVTRGTFDPAAIYAVDAIINDVRDALAQLPGHDHTHQGIDGSNGRLVTVTTWDTEEHARFSRDQLGDDIVRKIEAASIVLEPAEVYSITTGYR